MREDKNKPSASPMRMINDFFENRPGKTLLDTMDDLFTRQSGKMYFGVHLSETMTHYIVKAEIPGVSKDEIDLELEGQQLVIRLYPHKSNKDGAKWDGAKRMIDLPGNALLQDMKAQYQNGILTVRFPKKQGRKITID
ncbi:Hsp20/alpha crystallin family protein [Bacillus sp. FJAT-42376]|uniref:Hsp20/alpha crystallin family protein n=1 Tax=Bacillus sp. FJAT-42376 TaxID=2014076 RepID=UPI000F515215|nr:Hsp20/alpha crystallin family protein [Bacillus sp. FJAT-42376]AZB42752.1 Hsp20/alpha crystallin family protein [Bacillus sp. FJAT-42376]